MCLSGIMESFNSSRYLNSAAATTIVAKVVVMELVATIDTAPVFDSSMCWQKED